MLGFRLQMLAEVSLPKIHSGKIQNDLSISFWSGFIFGFFTLTAPSARRELEDVKVQH